MGFTCLQVAALLQTTLAARISRSTVHDLQYTSDEKPPSIYEGGSEVSIYHASHVKMMRQGKVINEIDSDGSLSTNFSEKMMHKEFLFIAKNSVGLVEKPIFAKKSDLCGVGLFSSDDLVCSELGTVGSQDIVDKVAADLKVTAAPTEIQRGFGIEFELVSRKPTEEMIASIKKDVLSNLGFRIGTQIYNGIMGLRMWWAELHHQTKHLKYLSNYSDLEDIFLNSNNSFIFEMPALKECFSNTTQSAELKGKSCSQTTDCALNQFCMDCDACTKSKQAFLGDVAHILDKAIYHIPSGWKEKLDPFLCKGCSSRDAKICQPRSQCAEGLSADGTACLTPLDKWDWTYDFSVRPMTKEDATLLGGNHENEGVGFELVSPPLSGNEGIRSAVEVLTLLKGMGVQAGTSAGLHVHVNVASDKVAGSQLSPRQIANLWVAFAKFQLVIDEMHSPSRVPSGYARSLFLGSCEQSFLASNDEDEDEFCLSYNPCHCAKRFFKQIHEYVNKEHGADVKDFCNAALATKRTPLPCNERYADQRYYALNIMPLVRLGTVEFRAHAATYDSERVLRWTQFVLAFVEHFGAGAHDASRPFLDVPVEEGLEALARAQRMATTEELFSALEGKINPKSQEFYQARSWEENAPGCDIEVPPTSEEKKLEEFRKGSKLQRAIGSQIIVSKNSDEE